MAEAIRSETAGSGQLQILAVPPSGEIYQVIPVPLLATKVQDEGEEHFGARGGGCKIGAQHGSSTPAGIQQGSIGPSFGAGLMAGEDVVQDLFLEYSKY